MDSKVHLLIKVLLYLGVLSSLCEALQNLQIKISPGNQVKVGSDVTVKCSLDQSFGVIDLVWVRKVGSYVQKVGTSSRGIMSLEPDFQRLGRYSLSESTEGTQHVYTLKVTGARLEDAGTLGCQRGSYLGSGETYHQALAVCEKTGTSSCKCMVKEGWASPTCFKVPPDAQKTIDTYKNALIGVVICLAIAIIYGIVVPPDAQKTIDTYKNALIGVVICLAIAIIYGIVVSIMLYRDVIARMKARAEKKLEELKNKQKGQNVNRNEEHQQLNINDSGSQSSDGQFISQYEDLQRPHGEDIAAEASMYQQINVDVHNEARMRHQYQHQQQQYSPHVPKSPQNPDAPKTPQSLRPPERNYHGSSGLKPNAPPPPTESQSAHVNPAYRRDNDEDSLPNYKQIESSDKSRRYGNGNQSEYDNGARPKSYNPDLVSNDPRYQHLQANNIPNNRHHTSGFGKNNNVPYQQKSPGFNNNRKEYGQQSPGFNHNRKESDQHHYDGGVQTISQSVTSNSKQTPQSTKSERRPERSSGPEPESRGAYTDVQKESHNPSRSRYTQPKRLNFINGNVPVDNNNGPYVSQTDTVI